jgi:glycosyltransferase involved in cell wall biosynthesis
MTVLQMGPYPPPHGGVQTNLVALRKYILEQGIACPVINLTRFRREDHDGIYYPKTGPEVAKLLLTLDYDLIHLHAGGDFSPRHAGVLLLCSLLPKKKTVFTFHSGGYPGSEAGQRANPRSFRGFVLRRLDGIIAINQDLLDLFLRFGVAPQRIRLIAPHAVEKPSADAPLPQAIEAFYAAHDPLLVTVSGLEPEYDVRLQIEAIGRLHEKFPRLGLAIIGGGSLEQEIRKQVDAAPHREHLMLCGDIPHETTLRAIERSNLFLRTTWYDGDSISVREALHLGIPVIATDNGMRPPGVHLIPKSDAAALCLAVEACLNGAAKSASPSATGTENLEAVLRLYTDLLENSREAYLPEGKYTS